MLLPGQHVCMTIAKWREHIQTSAFSVCLGLASFIYHPSKFQLTIPSLAAWIKATWPKDSSQSKDLSDARSDAESLAASSIMVLFQANGTTEAFASHAR